MKKDIKRVIILYNMSFIIPFIIIMAALIGLHITPFGDHTLLISDAKGLYISDLSYISRALCGMEDLLYSFKSGIGMNLMGSHSGLLNPMNAIVLFFDITNYPYMYSILMTIDISICGLTMFIFISVLYGSDTKNLIFSSIYALMGFNVAYCYHYNFILSPELLPLIALGIHRIIHGKKPWLYLFSLSYGIFASFYFGYMLCIASVVIFTFMYIRDRDQLGGNKSILLNYIGSSLIAGLLPTFMWMPELLSFSGGRLEQNSILDFTLAENQTLGEMLAKFFIGSNDLSEQVGGRPNVFIGTLALFLVLLFFFDNRNNWRKKLLYAFPLAFYFISFYISAFSMAMQGFSATNWFNFRYSFVFSFFMITVAYEEFIAIREINAGRLKRAILAFLVFVFVVFCQRYTYVKAGAMLLGLAILALSLAIIWWNRIDAKKAPQKLLVIFLIILCSIESYANYIISTGNIQDWEVKESDFQKTVLTGSAISDALKMYDKSFYRVTNELSLNDRASNDPRLYGYDGTIYFGSCMPTFIYQGLSKLGMPWWYNRMWYRKGIPEALDALLGIRYVVAQRDLVGEKNYDYLLELEGNKIYRNNNSLPIAMIADENVIEANARAGSPFENHNTLWKAITGLDSDVFTIQKDIDFTYRVGINGESINSLSAKENSGYKQQINVEEDASIENSKTQIPVTANSADDIDTIRSSYHIECTFIAQKDGPVYGYNGMAVDEKTGYQGEALHCLGIYHKGDIVKDYLPLGGQINSDMLKMICAEYSAAYPENEVLSSYCKKIREEAGYVNKLTDSHLMGEVTVNQDSRLFFTIPYDEGWTIIIDGEKKELEKTTDLFMSVPVSEGKHAYELVFFPRGMKTGIYTSCGAVILLLILIVLNISWRRRPDVSAEGGS